MDGFEERIINAFNIWSIDIKNKVLSDALIPLHIVSSNLTKGVPTIFKGNVPVLTALKASCCIPGLFRPQVIKNNVYIDGGYFTSVLMKLLPKEIQNETLAIDIVHTHPGVTPTNLEKMAIPAFLYRLYKLSCLYEAGNNKHPNILNVYHSSGSGFDNLTEKEKTDMLLAGRTFMKSFLSKVIL
jgi:predicted acylesterase/phospholipase RssA